MIFIYILFLLKIEVQFMIKVMRTERKLIKSRYLCLPLPIFSLFLYFPCKQCSLSTLSQVPFTHPTLPSISTLFFFFVRRICYIVRILVISRREGSRSFKRHNAEQILPRSFWILSHVFQPLVLQTILACIPPSIQLVLSLPTTGGALARESLVCVSNNLRYFSLLTSCR